MSKNKEDGHGAAKAGISSENKFKLFVESCGYSLLKLKEEFVSKFGEEKGVSLWKESREIPIPLEWGYLDKKTFQTDGYIPEFDVNIELKYSNASGTTEEKVMYDLLKIKDGVYSNKKLIYIFFGPRAKNCDIFKHFHREVKKIDPTEEKVKVILDDTEELSAVSEYLKSLETSQKMAA
jgi:hypothetical protein